jgi:hypothetical protein
VVTLSASARVGWGWVRRIGILLMIAPAAWHAGADRAMATRSISPLEAGASGARVGVGGPGESRRPGTLAEAAADHAETVRKCRLLSVKAVREECLRQAQRTLEQALERLHRGTGAGR